VAVVLFLAGHAALAIVMHLYKPLATVHGFLALAVGIWLAARARSVVSVACAGAYLVGSEVLWRMIPHYLFYEYGKYAVTAVLGVGMIRLRGARPHSGAVLAFLLLIPSSLITAASVNPDVARRYLSFNLSGQLALLACVVFFHNVALTRQQLCRILVTYMGPATGVVAVVILVFRRRFGSIHFASDSNVYTSGGFGPNQVSAVLGLAAVAALLCLIFVEGKWRGALKPIFLVCLVGFAGQSAFTFSRGGLYMAAGASAVACFYLMRNTRTLSRLLSVGAAAAAAFVFLVAPRLQSLTGGALLARFQDTNLSNRDKLIREEIEIWKQHPFLGVGPGMASLEREGQHQGFKAHTEFSRLLAEHGLLGAASILILLGSAWTRFRQSQSQRERAVVAAAVAWALMFMGVNALRLVAPSFVFGLAFAAFVNVKRKTRRRAAPHVNGAAPRVEACYTA
jgi:O-antigen ligase